jgi:(4S)-4-hydroxy-5-phosphonooxypentane-2,3-dione isomerase
MSSFIVVVDLDIGPDDLNVFMPLLRANAAASLRCEPGCRQFEICRDASSPGTMLLYEVYDDEAAFAAHLVSPHYLDFDSATGGMIRSKGVRKFRREV